MERRWWRRPRQARVGTEPDYRFSLANERTMLAYLRTGLALMAAGAALIQLFDGPIDTASGIGLVGLGVAVAVGSYRRWRQVELALRRDEPLPVSRLPLLVVAVLSLVGVAVLATRWWSP